MLFLGDFIYIDLPVRFGTTFADYATAYRKVYASTSWSDALRSLSWILAYDDHEIVNDYAGNDNSAEDDDETASEISPDIDLYNAAISP